MFLKNIYKPWFPKKTNIFERRNINMFNKKRGLAPIVATLLIVVITIAAIGIVWTVINTTMSEQLGEISKLSCRDIDLSIVNLECNAEESSTVTLLQGKTSSHEISKLVFVLANETTSDRYEETENIGLTNSGERKTFSPEITTIENPRTMTVIYTLKAGDKTFECSEASIKRNCP
jgi:flagellin-like protein